MVICLVCDSELSDRYGKKGNGRRREVVVEEGGGEDLNPERKLI